MKIELKKAITHKGSEITTLDLDLDSLTGNDLIEVEDQIMKTGTPIQTTDFSRVYLISVAARTLHMPVEVLKFMGARDFARVVNEVRNFLLNSDSEATDTEASPEIPPAI
ncbi:MAG: phage tail assembly protein [Synergistaceae bacterium]|nr:phage tail assembly protein [Synergistaceae bacterium]